MELHPSGYRGLLILRRVGWVLELVLAGFQVKEHSPSLFKPGFTELNAIRLLQCQKQINPILPFHSSAKQSTIIRHCVQTSFLSPWHEVHRVFLRIIVQN